MTPAEETGRLEQRDPRQLEPDPRNPKTHPAHQVVKIAESIKTAGFCAPILVRGNRVIAGHGRLQAALSLDLETVPVVVLDHLTDDQVAFLLAADNRLGESELAPYDPALLSALLAEIDAGALELSATGFEDEDLARLMEEIETLPGESSSGDAGGEEKADDEDIAPAPAIAAKTWPIADGETWGAGVHRVICGDCRLHLAELDPVDCVITDPPYGLEFMDSAWDRGVPDADTWRHVLAAMKPGAPLIAFGGSRTFHRLATAIEDAGFEIRDCLVWLYGSGFPKGGDLGKSIDRRRDDRAETLEVTAWIRAARDAAGITNREIDAAFGFNGQAGHWTTPKSQPTIPTPEQLPKLLELLGNPTMPPRIEGLLSRLTERKGSPGDSFGDREVVGERTAHDSSTARLGCPIQTQGFVVSSTRTIQETIAATEDGKKWQGWSTSLKPAWEPIILARKPYPGTIAAGVLEHETGALNIDGCRVGDARRWPANVVLDEEAGRALDAQAGTRGARAPVSGAEASPASSGAVTGARARVPGVFHGDAGGPSRFFYSSKASQSDRGQGNTHATVKPTDLMRWLVRLVTPPGGRVLDPFAGSGTTGKAAQLEGARFVGIELIPDHASIVLERLSRLGCPPKKLKARKR